RPCGSPSPTTPSPPFWRGGASRVRCVSSTPPRWRRCIGFPWPNCSIRRIGCGCDTRPEPWDRRSTCVTCWCGGSLLAYCPDCSKLPELTNRGIAPTSGPCPIRCGMTSDLFVVKVEVRCDPGAQCGGLADHRLGHRRRLHRLD